MTGAGSRLRRLTGFLLRRPTGLEPPREWMVESTNRCNLACPMCTRQLARFHPEDMRLGFFEHLLDRHPEVEAVWPYGFGEPLLHPEIFDFIRAAKVRGKAVCLSTNATLLDAGRTAALLESGLDYLILAVDGATTESYGENRYPASLTETESRIESFLADKLARRFTLHVTVQMVRMRSNAGEVGRFLRRWRRPGVDVVRVRDDLSGLPGIALGRSPRPRRRRPCFFLWRGPLFVEASGSLLPCPYYHGAEPFADLRRQSAVEAWNSAAMVDLRAAHVRGDLSRYPVCDRCPRHQPNAMLAAIGFFVTTRHIRRFLPHVEHLQRRMAIKLFE